MIGVVVNAMAIVLGSILGLILRRALPERVSRAVTTALGLCVVFLGIKTMLSGAVNDLAVILGMVTGGVAGSLIGIQKGVERLGAWTERRFSQKEKGAFDATGFVAATLLFCVGAMAITGSIQAGQGDNGLLYTKAILDGLNALMMTVSLGFSVVLSAVVLFLYQGAIALASGVISNHLSADMMQGVICTGGLLIAALGTNMLGVTKIKVADYLPALLATPLFCLLLSFIG